MKKIIFLFAATSLTLFGMSYSQFKKNVLRHSKILQSNQLNLSASKQENTILMRPSNPTLELEVSQFNPEFGDTRPGYRATYGQAIRTGGFYDSLSQKAVAQKILQEAYVSEGEAGFLRELERLYTEYVYQNHLYTLLQQDLKISQRVANIAKDRYESGAESRAQYIQAKTEAMMAKTEILSVKREVTVIYYQMLGLAGFDKRVSLQKSFIYPVSAKITIGTNSKSPSVIT